MARRQFSNRQFRKTPANRAWSGFIPATMTNVAAGTKVLVGGFTLSNPNIDETILRTVGMISVGSGQQSATEDQIGAFGMMIVSDLAVAAGAASIPGPVTDNSDDAWFVWVPFAQRSTFDVSAGVTSVKYDFDSKAMRTVEEGFGLAVMVENAHAVHSLVFQMSMSLLSSRA